MYVYVHEKFTPAHMSYSRSAVIVKSHPNMLMVSLHAR